MRMVFHTHEREVPVKTDATLGGLFSPHSLDGLGK